MIVGMIGGMLVSGMFVRRLGRHLFHIGILFIAAGTTALALMLTGVHSASTWDLVPGLLLVGAGIGIARRAARARTSSPARSSSGQAVASAPDQRSG
jgi:hypothetical protein